MSSPFVIEVEVMSRINNSISLWSVCIVYNARTVFSPANLYSDLGEQPGSFYISTILVSESLNVRSRKLRERKLQEHVVFDMFICAATIFVEICPKGR